MHSQPNRISVIGTSGSGKSTFARNLALKIHGEYIELDSHFHGPNWTPTPDELFIPTVRQRMTADRWVVDGSYGNRAGQYENSDLIIWLDYSFRIVLWRMLRRTFKRLVKKEELWNGNRESLRMAFSKDSIILWVFQTYWKRRREIPTILNVFPPEKSLRFYHPREAETWLHSW